MEWAGAIDTLATGLLRGAGATRPDTIERLRVTLLSVMLWAAAGLGGGLVLALGRRILAAAAVDATSRWTAAMAALGLAGWVEQGRLVGATGRLYGWDGVLYLPLLGLRVAALWVGLVGLGTLVGGRRGLLERALLGAALLSLAGVFVFNAWGIPVGTPGWLALAWIGRLAGVFGAVVAVRPLGQTAGPGATIGLKPAAVAGWLGVALAYLPLAGNAAPPDADMATLGTMARWLLAGQTATSIVGPAGQALEVRYPASGAFATAFFAAAGGLAVHEAALAWWALAPLLAFAAVARMLRALAPRAPGPARLGAALAVTLLAVLHDTHLLGAYPRLLAWTLGALAVVTAVEATGPWALWSAGLLFGGAAALQPLIALGFALPLAVAVARAAARWGVRPLARPVALAALALLVVFAPLLGREAVAPTANPLLIGPAFAWPNLTAAWPWLAVAGAAGLALGVAVLRRHLSPGKAALGAAWLVGALAVTYVSRAASGSLGVGAAAAVVLTAVVLAWPRPPGVRAAWPVAAVAVLVLWAAVATSQLGFTAGFSLLSLADGRFLARHAGRLPVAARLLALEPPRDPDWQAFGVPIHQWWVPSFAAVRVVDWRINEHHVVHGQAGPTPAQWACHRAPFDRAAAGCDWTQIDAILVGSRNRGTPGIRPPPGFELVTADDELRLFARPAGAIAAPK